jgi:hypothetical protein
VCECVIGTAQRGWVPVQQSEIFGSPRKGGGWDREKSETNCCLLVCSSGEQGLPGLLTAGKCGVLTPSLLWSEPFLALADCTVCVVGFQIPALLDSTCRDPQAHLARRDPKVTKVSEEMLRR